MGLTRTSLQLLCPAHRLHALDGHVAFGDFSQHNLDAQRDIFSSSRRFVCSTPVEPVPGFWRSRDRYCACHVATQGGGHADNHDWNNKFGAGFVIEAEIAARMPHSTWFASRVLHTGTCHEECASARVLQTKFFHLCNNNKIKFTASITGNLSQRGLCLLCSLTSVQFSDVQWGQNLRCINFGAAVGQLH